MILLVGGASCSGKTALAYELIKETHFPCFSLDHLKMGLVRGWPACPFTADDDDQIITDALWPIVLGIIETNIENGQNLILEGCYFPYESLAKLIRKYPDSIRAGFIVFSADYIQDHFADFLAYREVVEKRLYLEERTAADLITQHTEVKKSCDAVGLTYVEVSDDYTRSLRELKKFFLAAK